MPTGAVKEGCGCPVLRGSVHDHPAYRKWKLRALRVFERYAPAAPLDGPLQMTLVAIFPTLKGDERVRVPAPRKWHDVIPDADNVQKAVMDVATRAGWVKDDSRICRVVFEKLRAAQGEHPGLSIVIGPAPAIRQPGALF